MSIMGVMLGGLIGLILIGVPLAFAIASISAGMLHFQAELPLWVFMQRFYAGVDSFVLVAIPFFLLTGNIMNRGNITDRIIRLCYALVGHIRGGLALVNTLASMFFGGISGSAVADTAGIGSILIPAMIKKGYTPSFSVTLTATTSVMGQIIPPSIIMIVYAATAGNSVGALFLAGVVPGLLLGISFMLISYIYAIKFNFPAEERQSLRQIWEAVRDAALTMGAPLIIIGGVVTGAFTATESSVVAALYALVLACLVYRTLPLREVPQILLDTAKMSAVTLFAIGTASMFGWLMGYFRITDLAAGWVKQFSTGPILFILFVIALFLILGTFMDAVPAIIIFVPVVVPAATALGIHPIHIGLIITVVLGFGLVTPPYGLCILMGASIAKIPIQKTFRDLGVVLAVIMAVTLMMAFLPDVILFLPRLLMPKFM